jgi:hypothetical protein
MDGYEELLASKGTPEPQPVEMPPVVEAVVEPTPVQEPVTSEPPPAVVEAAPEVDAPPAAPATQDQMAPVRAILDERDRRQAAERKAQEVERQLQSYRDREAEQQRKAREAADQIPHPLDDPDGFSNGIRGLTTKAVREAQSQWQVQQDRVVEALSRSAIVRHIGKEEFAELQKFASTAPQNAHDAAYDSGDPWGWMQEKREQFMAAKRDRDAIAALGGKSVDERIAEAKAQAIAEARAQWEAEHGGGQPQPSGQPAPDTRARNPDGTFAPTNSTKPHQPPSLSVVPSAVTPRGEDARGGYDALFKRG